jgi:hypothetical protein
MNRSVVARPTTPPIPTPLCEEEDRDNGEGDDDETDNVDANEAASKDACPQSLMGDATPVMAEVRFLGEDDATRKESTDRVVAVMASCC